MDHYHTSQRLSRHKSFINAKLHSEIEDKLLTNRISLTNNQISLVVEFLKIDIEDPKLFRKLFNYLKLFILYREVGGTFHTQIEDSPDIEVPDIILSKFSKTKIILEESSPSYNCLFALELIEECIERMKEAEILIYDSNGEIQATSPFFSYLTYVELYNNVLRSNAVLK